MTGRPARTRREERILAVLSGPLLRHYLGPGNPADHLEHALAFAEVVVAAIGQPPERFADLGTGGGVPGLVLAGTWEASAAVLIESSRRRCSALERAVLELGMATRVTVAEGRAEGRAHEASLRERFEAVTARGFARPAPTAEIATGFVAVGGVVVVSDPPEPDPNRWPEAELESLGLGPAVGREARGLHFSVMRKVGPAPPDVPRPIGRPTKRPRW